MNSSGSNPYSSSTASLTSTPPLCPATVPSATLTGGLGGHSRAASWSGDHFVEAIAHKVIDASLRVSWFTLEPLTTTIGRATVDDSVAKTITKRAELIVIGNS